MGENTQDKMGECVKEGTEPSCHQKDEAIRLIKDNIGLIESTEDNTSTTSPSIDVEKIIYEHKTKLFGMIDEERTTFLKSDKQFFEFLKNFVQTQEEKDKQKIALKEIFFFVVMAGFLVIMVTPFALIMKLKDMNQITAVVSLLTVLVEMVSAIKILPQIIAEYLFNKEEDTKLMEIIETMQKYNQNKRDYISKFK